MGRPRPQHIKRKKGDHTAENMLKALRLNRSGMSIRQASKTCKIAYATLHRYIVRNINVSSDQLATKRLTPHYDKNKIFTEDQEEELKNFYESYTTELTAKECRKMAYKMAAINNLPVPESWKLNESAGKDWFRSFRVRHPEFRLKSQLSNPDTSVNQNLEKKSAMLEDKQEKQLEVSEFEDQEEEVEVEVPEWREEGIIDSEEIDLIKFKDALSAFSVDSGSEETRSSQNDEEHQEIKKEVPISGEIDEDSELVTQEYAPSLHLTSSQAGQGQNETGDPLLFTTESQPHIQTHRITEKSPQTDARAARPRTGVPSGPTKQNEVLKIHCLKQKMSIMEKEYLAAQERAKELHNMELMVMKEKFREAKAKADLAELLLKQQMEKTSMLSKPTPSTVKVRLFANE